ncbi:hypothetical protein [Thiorhodospira sibirica]|uniref:hypothetical protein n=1 Tax=Thiorhodospira sibirica TaxID=154347 RepID=UPI00022C0B53|nr:hypothetical protein [Thiorhodospira sibirica]
MAQYEQEGSELARNITNTPDLSPETVSAIRGATGAYQAGSQNNVDNRNPDYVRIIPQRSDDGGGDTGGGDTGGGAGGRIPPEVVVVLNNNGIDLTLNTVDRVILTGRGNDRIVVNGDGNTTIESLGGNDTLITSGGHDSIVTSAGNDSVSTGAGNDTIYSRAGQDSVDGGAGFDKLKIHGSSSDYNVSVVNGAIVIDNSSGHKVTARNIEYIKFNDGSAITASTTADHATIMRMYESLLDRSATAGEAGFYAHWLQQGNVSLAEVVRSFLAVDAVESRLGQAGVVEDSSFVANFYQLALGRAATADEIESGVAQIAAAGYGEFAVTVISSAEAVNLYADSVMVV